MSSLNSLVISRINKPPQAYGIDSDIREPTSLSHRLGKGLSSLPGCGVVGLSHARAPTTDEILIMRPFWPSSCAQNGFPHAKYRCQMVLDDVIHSSSFIRNQQVILVTPAFLTRRLAHQNVIDGF